jgi:hypothetical protein
MAQPFSDPVPRTPEELNPDPAWLDAFARVEGLIGEEAALLKIPARERTAEQHERLRGLGAELDRIWERLRRRAEDLGRPGFGEPGG